MESHLARNDDADMGMVSYSAFGFVFLWPPVLGAGLRRSWRARGLTSWLGKSELGCGLKAFLLSRDASIRCGSNPMSAFLLAEWLMGPFSLGRWESALFLLDFAVACGFWVGGGWNACWTLGFRRRKGFFSEDGVKESARRVLSYAIAVPEVFGGCSLVALYGGF